MRLQRKLSLELVLLTLIVLAASWLRFSRLSLCEFKADEAVAIDLALPLIDGTGWPEVGLMSSVGINNTPLFMYLLYPPMLFSIHPPFLSGFVALLSVAAIVILFVVLRSRFGPAAALLSCALWASAPRAVLYARKIWSVSVLALFVVLLLYMLFLIVERNKTVHVLWLPILFGTIAQLHPSAAGIIPVVGIVIVARARQIRWSAFLLGVVAALIMLLPYLHHQWTHDWVDFRLIQNLARQAAGATGSLDLRPLSLTVDLLGSGGFEYVTGRSHAAFVAHEGQAFFVASVVSSMLLLLFSAAIIATGIRLARGAERTPTFPFFTFTADNPLRGVLWLWILGMWVVSVLSGHTTRPHYFILVHPAPFILVALLLRDVARLVPERYRQASTGVMAIFTVSILVSFILFSARFFEFLAAQRGTNGDYGTVYSDKHEAVAYALAHGLTVVAGQPEIPLLEKLLARDVAEAPARQGTLQLWDRHRESPPYPCPSGETRDFGALSGCVR